MGPTASVDNLKKKSLSPTKIQSVNHPNPLPSHYIDRVVAGTVIHVGQLNPNSFISPLCVSAGGS